MQVRLACLCAMASWTVLAGCGSGRGNAPATDTFDLPAGDGGEAQPGDLPPDRLPESSPDAPDVPEDPAPDAPPDSLPEVVVPACVGAPGRPAWPTDASATFLRGPFVQDVRDSHAVVAFRPAKPPAAQGCVTWTVEGSPAAVPAQRCVAADALGQYEVRIDALPPDTAVTYQVTAGTGLAAGPFVFRSAPPLDRPQRILMVSDLHCAADSSPDVSSKIVAAALADGVDFAVACGDYVDVAGEAEFDVMFDRLRPLLHRVPMFTAMGNHEARDPSYFEAFALPVADPPDPASPELYYAFRRGNAWIGVLELMDWELSWAFGVSIGQVEWLAKELDSEAAQSARWRLLVIHEPPWGRNWAPCAPPRYGEESLRNLLVPMARDKGVSAIFSGDFHDYEHGTMDGVELFVLGGGGGGLENVTCELPEGMPEPWKGVESHHRLTVETGCDALTVVATDVDGNEIDRVVVSPPPVSTSSAPAP